MRRDKDDVLSRVRDHLGNLKTVPLTVVGDREDGDWLYVIVTPSRPGVRAYDYVASLSKVEEQLEGDGFPNVLVVPSMRDEPYPE